VPVRADPIRVAQVIGNLLQNGAKFTPRGGRATLSVEQTEDIERSRRAGFDLHLAKPPNLDALERVMSRFVLAGSPERQNESPAVTCGVQASQSRLQLNE
jgi:signal transduction histidine kinase